MNSRLLLATILTAAIPDLSYTLNVESCTAIAIDAGDVIPTVKLNDSVLLYNNLGGMGPDTLVPAGLSVLPSNIRYAGAIAGQTSANATSREDRYAVRCKDIDPSHYVSCR